MAIDYKTVKYDPDKNYQLEIDQAASAGETWQNNPYLKQLETKKAAKIYSNPDLTKQYEKNIPTPFRMVSAQQQVQQNQQPMQQPQPFNQQQAKAQWNNIGAYGTSFMAPSHQYNQNVNGLINLRDVLSQYGYDVGQDAKTGSLVVNLNPTPQGYRWVNYGTKDAYLAQQNLGSTPSGWQAEGYEQPQQTMPNIYGWNDAKVTPNWNQFGFVENSIQGNNDRGYYGTMEQVQAALNYLNQEKQKFQQTGNVSPQLDPNSGSGLIAQQLPLQDQIQKNLAALQAQQQPSQTTGQSVGADGKITVNIPKSDVGTAVYSESGNTQGMTGNQVNQGTQGITGTPQSLGIDYSKVQFDKNTDYSKLISQAASAGETWQNSPYVKDLMTKMAAKIYSDPNLLKYENNLPTEFRRTQTGQTGQTGQGTQQGKQLSPLGVDYTTVQYDPNKDYSKLIADAESHGKTWQNDPQLKQWHIQRAAKIYNDPNLTQKYEATIPYEFRRQAPQQNIPNTLTGGDVRQSPEYQQEKTELYKMLGNMQQQNQQILQPLQNFQEYQSPYEQQLAQMLQQQLQGNNFQYDPNTDTSLKAAQDQVMLRAREEAAARGAMYGDTAQSMVAQEAAKLIPTYEEKAYQRFNDKFQRNMQLTNLIMEMDRNAYQKNQDKFTRMMDTANLVRSLNADERQTFFDIKTSLYNERKIALEEQQNQIDNRYKALDYAFKKVEQVGFVDNETSSILGLPVGTLSARAKEAARAEQFELKKMSIEHGNRLKEIETTHNYDVEIQKMTQAFNANESEKDRTWKASEASKERSFTASEKAKDRSLTVSENAKDRSLQYYKANNSGSGSKQAKQDASDTYNGFVNIFANGQDIDPKTGKSYTEDALQKLLYNPQYKEVLLDKYNDAIKAGQSAYYNQIANNWSDKKSLAKELTSSSKTLEGEVKSTYYKRMLGDKYNSLAYPTYGTSR